MCSGNAPSARYVIFDMSTAQLNLLPGVHMLLINALILRESGDSPSGPRLDSDYCFELSHPAAVAWVASEKGVRAKRAPYSLLPWAWNAPSISVAGKSSRSTPSIYALASRPLSYTR